MAAALPILRRLTLGSPVGRFRFAIQKSKTKFVGVRERQAGVRIYEESELVATLARMFLE